uniref:Pallidipin-like lipocalin 1 n=1 Tax=Rhodnius prolixus TaxID=13249 RepID=Q7YT02_RHOPR|nr:pallidipin-like lipocalin 1 precursor [Rhodnius prolixus]
MNTTFAVIFLGILVVTNAASCQKKEPKDNFDSNKYFSAKLEYVQRVSEGPKQTVCIKFDFKRGSDGKVTSNYDYYGSLQNQNYHNSCNGTQRSNNKGQFSFKCQQTSDKSSATPNFQEEMTVMETDYNTFSVVSRCVRSGGFSSGSILVLSKTDAGNGDSSELKKYLEEHSDITFEHERSKANCTVSTIKNK